MSTGEFSINGQGASIGGVWTQPALTDHPVKIDYIIGGNWRACDDAVVDLTSVGGSVFPNPATDVLNVNVGSLTNANVQLVDVTGKVAASATGVSGTTSFNTSSVTAGLYVLNVSSASGTSTAKILVK